ncbi:MAG: TetR/AcrR family transcriptional regulator [Saprospiraceae bacterium]|nr:TetR/AcrR family transcriptional regulator [Saprospiraceae bacterium]MCB0623206.1 TetR/AcrR family transcriptional regulator [Saprospiraceae bacterium]MCB0675392.1 TetR/AcrR family transcriptional regulator [Saprospiraceae bacterium]MCB0681285.1 TetR/AcrR family transcriptional regulator [Saprospiraceae bacterium]
MPVHLQIKLNDRLYLRDPQETKLGRKIIQHSILLIDEIGFESFTFKKLAERIGSTEASVYRYFVNKHLLLVYLSSWYWEWMKFQIDFHTMNIQDPRQRLEIVLSVMVDTAKRNASIEFVDEDVLHRIVVAEATKAYHTKDVDLENRRGYFLTFKALSKKIADIIKEIDPGFPYPQSMASNLLEMANTHIYFAQHLPSLTDVQMEENQPEKLVEMLHFFAFGLLEGAKPSK